ncbi:MFS transporter [Falsiroseomonas selenitidurans]|uniref:MFS transporter n=1 Tax=Falsiroseomonas selenitidurans TaxID=2716335 RepID=A0ABX1DX12_9PROT|nr:MFS transporter [Falsiroseomonas selenitidurans]NKC29459.1 MFS transporter [Falsiroseomonas selenitidurans]
MSLPLTAPPPAAPPASPFRGWRVAWAAFAVAVLGWGIGFYGPPVFLLAVQRARGWPVPLIATAITCHFLASAAVVAWLPALHRRLGLAGATRLGGVLAGLGVVAWALAGEPWQLHAATMISGAGWAMTGGAAINAMVAPWFIRRRPAALSLAYNGASVGGALFSPLWVALIEGLGFAQAALLLGAAMACLLWWLSGRYLAGGPEAWGQSPDGLAAPPPGPAPRPAPTLPGSRLWRDRGFVTLALATALSLFAQIGLIVHLFSLIAGPLGAQGAGFAAGLATACAILGRSLVGALLPEAADRRRVAAANFALQAAGSLLLLASGGVQVPLLLAGLVLFGLGLGNVTSLPPMIVQRDFAAGDTARAVALVTACGQAAYAFAPAGFALLRDDAGSASLFLAAAALQVAAALAVLAGRRR